MSFDVPPGGARGEVAEPPARVPIGEAATRREGGDLTMVSIGVGVHRALEAAAALAADGVESTVIDLRSAAPLDHDAILDSATRTGRVLVVDEDYRRGGLSGEIAAILAEAGIRCGFARVTTEGTLPYSRELEDRALPSVERILAAARRLADDSEPAYGPARAAYQAED